MEKSKQLGIGRASMRSSKRLEHRLKAKVRSVSTRASNKVLKKAIKEGKEVFGMRKSRFKDSIKLRKAGMKSRIARKVCNQNARNNRPVKKDKENIVNGVQSLKNKKKLPERMPFSNLQVFGNQQRRGAKKTPFKLSSKNLPRKSPLLNLERQFCHSLIEETLEIEEKPTMEIEIEAKEDDKVTQFYSDILKYIISDSARVEPENYFYKSLFPERYRRAYINWLIKMHKKFDLADKTYFLAVNLFDRYAAKNEVTKDKLKLLLCASLLIASKYEEILFNELRDYQIISNYEFTKEQLLDMEGEILKSLDFKIFQTCHVSVIEIIRQHYSLEPEFTKIVTYILKLCTVDSRLCFKSSPHLVISACHFVIKQCFVFVEDKELVKYLEDNSANLSRQLAKVVLENRFNSDCLMRKEVLNSSDAHLLLEIENNSRAFTTFLENSRRRVRRKDYDEVVLRTNAVMSTEESQKLYEELEFREFKN